ncbi:MAG: peptide chain release factor-like protein [Candidatus Dadabacteria bacterium]|nr:peptide chain release factor-like protein [Candidatus Dadabacteria bacterium]
MKSFGVSKEKQTALWREMKRLGIREEDIEETFTRSSGPGGQNVNKLATCVHLRHRPSGISVKVMRERSQALNRFLARRSLAEKIATQVHGEDSTERKKAQKIIKQKKRRKRRTAKKLAVDGGNTQ